MIPLTDVIRPRTWPHVTTSLVIVIALAFALRSEGAWIQVGLTLLYLWIFGGNVEDRLGHGRFLALCIAAAALGAAAHVARNHGSLDLGAAASGAASGVLGAYCVLYPQSQVLVLVPLPVMLAEVPALFFLGVWLVVLFLTGQGLVATAGLLAGAALVLPLQRPERRRVEWWSP